MFKIQSVQSGMVAHTYNSRNGEAEAKRLLVLASLHSQTLPKRQTKDDIIINFGKSYKNCVYVNHFLEYFPFFNFYFLRQCFSV